MFYRRPFLVALARSVLAALLFTAAFAGQVSAQDQRSFSHDGIARDYLIFGPASTSATGLAPLVIVLHGAGIDADNTAGITRFGDLAREEGFYAVFPDGIGPLFMNTWNAGHCCGQAMTEGIDDVGFIASLIDRLLATHPIDPDRIYVTGFSNGAMLAHRIGIELADRIAAIAPVAGTLFGDEPIARTPVPALIINNTDDRVVPPSGREPGVDGPLLQVWGGAPLLPAEYQARYWADVNGCERRSTLTASAAYRFESFACPAGVSVEFYLVNNNRHLWPGGDVAIGGLSAATFDATGVIWEFFTRHSRSTEAQEAEAVPL